MIRDVFLIDENYLKSVTSLGDNIDGKYIKPSIEKAQLQGLMPILGEKLFDKVCTLVQNDLINDPINEKYKTLLDVYISSYLVQKIQAEIQILLFSKQRNEGIITYVDNNNQAMSLNDVKFLINTYNQDSEFYANRMRDYLCANYQYFKEYCKKDKGEMKANISRSEFCKITL